MATYDSRHQLLHISYDKRWIGGCYATLDYIWVALFWARRWTIKHGCATCLLALCEEGKIRKSPAWLASPWLAGDEDERHNRCSFHVQIPKVSIQLSLPSVDICRASERQSQTKRSIWGVMLSVAFGILLILLLALCTTLTLVCVHLLLFFQSVSWSCPALSLDDKTNNQSPSNVFFFGAYVC